MRLILGVMALLLLVLLEGCAKPIVWTKSSFTEQEFQKDDYECQRDAKMAHPPAYFGGGLAGAAAAIGYQKEGERFYRQCMESKGWQAVKE